MLTEKVHGGGPRGVAKYERGPLGPRWFLLQYKTGVKCTINLYTSRESWKEMRQIHEI
jgi:hypothetical protein